MRSHHYNARGRGAGWITLYRPTHLPAIWPGHRNVEQDEVRTRLVKAPQRLIPVIRDGNCVLARGFEILANDISVVAVVVHHEHAHLLIGHLSLGMGVQPHKTQKGDQSCWSPSLESRPT